jgi:uncharacterized membrane protein
MNFLPKDFTMNRYNLIAAGIMAATAAIHIFAGTADVLVPMKAGHLDLLTATVMEACWHFVSLMLILIALGLGLASRHEAPALTALIIAALIGTTAIFLWLGVTRLGSLWLAPQWVLFLIPALLVGMGMVRR